MKKPLILTTCSNLSVEDTRALRLNHEYVNAVTKAGGIPVVAAARFGPCQRPRAKVNRGFTTPPDVVQWRGEQDGRGKT